MIHQVGRVHQKLIDGVYRNYSTNCTFITLHKPVKTLNMMYTIISLVHCLVCVSWQVLVETLLQHQGHILAPPLSTMFQPSNCCIYWLNNPVWIHYQLLFLQANGEMATLGVLLSLTNKPWWINILTVFPFSNFPTICYFHHELIEYCICAAVVYSSAKYGFPHAVWWVKYSASIFRLVSSL